VSIWKTSEIMSILGLFLLTALSIQCLLRNKWMSMRNPQMCFLVKIIQLYMWAETKSQLERSLRQVKASLKYLDTAKQRSLAILLIYWCLLFLQESILNFWKDSLRLEDKLSFTKREIYLRHTEMGIALAWKS